MGTVKGVKPKHLTASGLVKSGRGKLHAVSFSMGSTGSVVLCDNTSYVAGRIVAVYSAGPMGAGKFTRGFKPKFNFERGLFYQKSGTVEHVNFSVE